MYLVSESQAIDLTDEWVCTRVLELMDACRNDDAKSMASEWALSWPDDPFSDPLF